MTNIALFLLLLALPGFGADLWPFGGSGGNATKIRGVAVKSSLGCTDGQVITYVAANTQFECADVSVAGGSGDITSVTAGTGLTGGGTSGAVTLSLATVTASRALASDGSGYPTASSVTATELGYLSGVTGAIQTALDTKAAGASSLTTAGAIPYVASSGTLAQDSPALHWDATNNRLGLGTDSPATLLDMYAGTNTGIGLKLSTGSGTGYGYAIAFGSSLPAWVATAAPNARIDAAGNFVFNPGSGGDLLFNFDTRSTRSTYFDGLTIFNFWDTSKSSLFYGKVGIGPSNTSPAGTLHVYDATGSTGVTDVRFRAGVAQGTAPTPITRWYANDGTTVLASVSNLGALSAPSYTATGDFIGASTSFYYWGATGSDGSWRMGLSGGSMVIQKRESGSWVTKSTVAP